MSDISVKNPSAQFAVLFEGRGNLPATAMDMERAWRKIDEVGKRAILERIATGQLLNEIAIDLGVPVLAFRQWLVKNVSREELDMAREACAESLMLKSQLVLTVTYESPGHATIAKSFSERLAQMAERIHPEQWAPRKPQGDNAVPVTIVFENVGRAPEAKHVETNSGPGGLINAQRELDYIVVGDDEDSEFGDE
jgi:hypothetical protein